MRFSLGSDFGRRLLTALIGGPLVILVIYLGSPLYAVFVAAIGVICAFELWGMFRPSHLGLVMILSIILCCIVGIASNSYPLIVLPVAFWLAFGIIEVLLMAAGRMSYFARNCLYPILGALYVGLPLGVAILLRNIDHGFFWTGVMFANNWTTDGFALIGGRLIGKHKLAPMISPGKTVEGAVVGLIAGVLMGLIVMLAVKLTPTAKLSIALAVLINAVVSVLTMLGDLFESWLKRNFKIKDTGLLLPGHGGFLDRVDGLLFAIPGLYITLAILMLR